MNKVIIRNGSRLKFNAGLHWDGGDEATCKSHMYIDMCSTSPQGNRKVKLAYWWLINITCAWLVLFLDLCTMNSINYLEKVRFILDLLTVWPSGPDLHAHSHAGLKGTCMSYQEFYTRYRHAYHQVYTWHRVALDSNLITDIKSYNGAEIGVCSFKH